MSNTSGEHSNTDGIGFPGKHEIEDWVGDVVKPLIRPVQDIVNEIKGDISPMVGQVEALVKELVVTIDDDLKDAARDAKALLGKAPSFDKVVSTVDNFSKSVLTWEESQGAAVKQALTAFASTAAPGFEKMLALLGHSTAPVKALHDLEGHLRSVDDALLAPLALLTSHLDLGDAATKIAAFPGQLEALKAMRPGEAGAPGTIVTPEHIVVSIKALLSSISSVCGWVSASIPLSINLGISGGVAAGVEASAKGSVKIVSISQIVLGGIAMVCNVASAVLDSAALWIIDSDTEGNLKPIDSIKQSVGPLTDKADPNQPSAGSVQGKLDIALGELRMILLRMNTAEA